MSTSAFVKKLASNDRPTRDAAFESLKKYLSSTSKSLSLLEFEKLWKGLYFSMWFCDRPIPQQKLAEKLGELFSQVIPRAEFALFVEAFWVVMIKEWPSIDQWRIDKFYMLIRRVLRHCFIFLQKQEWDTKIVEKYNSVLEKLPLSGDKSISVALPYHLCDIFLDEIEFVIFQDIKEEGDEIDAKEEPEKYQEFYKKKIAIVESVPILTLIEPFAKLQKSALLRTLREKCKEDVLDDERLKDWGVVESASDDEDEAEEGEGESDDGESESDDDWNGFA